MAIEKKKDQEEKQKQNTTYSHLAYALDKSFSSVIILKISQTGSFRYNVYHLGCFFENIWIVIKYHSFPANVWHRIYIYKLGVELQSISKENKINASIMKLNDYKSYFYFNADVILYMSI